LAGVSAAVGSAPAPGIRWLGVPGGTRAELLGAWTLRGARMHACELLAQLTQPQALEAEWDLTQVKDLDIAGATLLWHAWGRRRPARLTLLHTHERLFERLAALQAHLPQGPPPSLLPHPLASIGHTLASVWRNGLGILALLGDVALCAVHVLKHVTDAPWKEISATIYHSGVRAVAITTLVGFVIGIVLSYLIGEQLHDFGADGYIVNLMGITSLRELGPVIAAILNAGRSGSSMTAQIGLMRVTSELDALAVLGISSTQRLVLPRVLGQIVALPLLVLWTDAMAVLGGMYGARLQLGVTYQTFLHSLPQVVPLANLWFGLGKGAFFGALIALVACYFGLSIRPDTEGLATGTTESVVTALTLVLTADAFFAVLFMHLGL
jgi:phospholipid/cholesterol/gamma-HCH transport system permease protein